MKTAVFLVMLAIGCARSTELRPGVYAIECSRSRAVCYEEAADVCPSGWDVADQGEQQGTYLYASNGSAQAVPTYRGSMLVECR